MPLAGYVGIPSPGPRALCAELHSDHSHDASARSLAPRSNTIRVVLKDWIAAWLRATEESVKMCQCIRQCLACWATEDCEAPEWDG